MNTVNQKLQCLMEGTFNESTVELDLKHEKWCVCANPTGFKFIQSEGGEQIWRHVTCGGLVIKPFRSNSMYNAPGR